MDSVFLPPGATEIVLNEATGVAIKVGVAVGVEVGVFVGVGVIVGVLVAVCVGVGVCVGVPGPTVGCGSGVGVAQTERAAYTDPTAFTIEPEDTADDSDDVFVPLFSILFLRSETLKSHTDFVSTDKPETCGAAIDVPLL